MGPRKIRITLSVVFMFVLLSISTSSFAQTVDTGTPAFGSFSGGPDVVNFGNLNLHYTVPVVSKPGRGMPFSYALVYDSSFWTPTLVAGTTRWQPIAKWGWVGQTQVAT